MLRLHFCATLILVLLKHLDSFCIASVPFRRASSDSKTTALSVLRDRFRLIPTTQQQEEYRDDNVLQQPEEDLDRAPFQGSANGLTFSELMEKRLYNHSGLNDDKKQQRQRYEAHFVAETDLPTAMGHFRMRGYRVTPAHPVLEPCVIYAADKPPHGHETSNLPVRVHDQCLTSEVFGSLRYVHGLPNKPHGGSSC